jgi:CHAT domain-containing protein/tetratricopeptide (TPR) repeat protein
VHTRLTRLWQVRTRLGRRLVLAGPLAFWSCLSQTVPQPRSLPPSKLPIVDRSACAHAERALEEAEHLRRGDVGESLKQSLARYDEAARLFESAGDRPRQAAISNLMGDVEHRIGARQQALLLYTRARAIWQELGERSGEAYSLRGIGLLHHEWADYGTAAEYLEQAVRLARGAGDQQCEGEALVYLGIARDSLGDRQKALDEYSHALSLAHALKDRTLEGDALQAEGWTHLWLAEYQPALRCFQEALSARKSVIDSQREALTLDTLALVYGALGEYWKALGHLREALRIQELAGDEAGAALTLHLLGRGFEMGGQTDMALDYFRQALPRLQAVGDRRLEGYTLTHMGNVLRDRGRTREAVEVLQQALPIQRGIGDRAGEADTLTLLAAVYRESGQTDRALELARQALAMKRSTTDRMEETHVRYELARVERARGNLTEARLQIEQVLARDEALRASVIGPDLQTAYFASTRDYYDFYIDVLMRLHQSHPSDNLDGLALQASERARARSLLDRLNEGRVDIHEGVQADVLLHERSLRDRLGSKLNLRIRLRSEGQREAAEGAAQEIDTLMGEWERVQEEIRSTSPRYAALTQPTPLTVREIQSQIQDSETLLLEYALGEERSFLWVLTANGMTVSELPPRKEIESATRDLYELLTARNRRIRFENGRNRRFRVVRADADYRSHAASLSRLLLGPVAGNLGFKRLVIVPDGALQYLPFAALPSPAGRAGPPLAARHEIVTLPSASMLPLLRSQARNRAVPTGTVAVIADPVFDRSDERVPAAARSRHPEESTEPAEEIAGGTLARASIDFDIGEPGRLRIPRLPFTRREAEAILRLVSPQKGIGALDFDADREKAMSGELARFRFVHFATHGFLNSQHPELSGLVLSLVDKKGDPQSGFLTAADVFNLKLPADLVVLSGCQTALGKEIRGEGLVGLTRAFFYAGASRVVASLWRVEDMATAELMKLFYGGMLGPRKLSAAAALRSAQLELSAHKRWSAPYYWAGFILQGEWR